jgi:SAM-dependent methyltransferase
MDELQPITDYTTYNGRMSLAMIDKLFFADKISPDLVVDFGCADGTLLRHLKALKPELEVVGYDTDPTMVAKYDTDAIPIFNRWEQVVSEIKFGDIKHPAIILSSVIHEICHYGSKADIDDFWKKVFETGFEYIVIRDMVPSRSIDRPSNVNDVKKIYHKFLHTKALTDFEGIWGSIEGNRQLVHFLLKYRYLEPNWNREVRENYLPVTREDLLAKIPNEYDVIFHEHYVLPYILQTVRDETGIEVKDATHMKLILKRNL